MARGSVSLNPATNGGGSSKKKKKSSSSPVTQDGDNISQTLLVRPAPETAPAKGHLRAHIHHNVLVQLHLKMNDPVYVYSDNGGEDTTPEKYGFALAWPAGPSIEVDRIQLNQSFRSITGIELGTKVHIKKWVSEIPIARNVLALHTSFTDVDMVKSYLADLKYIIPGLRLEVSKNVFVLIKDAKGVSHTTKPDLALDIAHKIPKLPSVYQYSPEITEIVLTNNENTELPSSPSITYESIGGLSKEIELLKSTVELPLHSPALFVRFGIQPPRGVLLHGPPGTGKTLLLKAVANESNAHILTISGPSIVSKYLGETESALRGVFDKATLYQPSIIFIDEIDALVPRRGGDEAGENESRVVATLLTLMDGMDAAGRVVVIGATNRPNNIDPALRRPGRFDCEIEIGIPDAVARLDILRLLLSRMPNDLEDSNIQIVASQTHGYVGADLSALCREAVMHCIRRGKSEGIYQDDLVVEPRDVEAALVSIQPSAMREIFLETPKVLWSDIGGQETVKKKLQEMVEWPLTHPDSFRRLGVQPPKGILLYGPPGCSKTLTAKALATEAGLNFLAVKGPELLNKYVGESERAVREIFRKARAASPSIIFFDELDALTGGGESHEESNSSTNRVVASLLNEMDGIEALVGVTVLAATNKPHVIDPALTRPGRLDRLVYVGPPDKIARKQILEIRTNKMSIDPNVDLDHLAELTDRFSGAELVALCQEAGLNAMNENIDADCVAMKHFDIALSNARRGITQEMLDFYENFRESGRL